MYFKKFVDNSLALEFFFDPGGASSYRREGDNEIFTTVLHDRNDNFVSKKVYDSNSRGETIYSQFIERAFDTVEGLGGYRLRCWEISHLESVNQARLSSYYETSIQIEDTTMQFYDKEIRQKMFDLRDALAEYVFFASQFCSYNNIDNKFNDFFVEAIRNEFGEPYPWEEAPLYFYSVDALIGASLSEQERTKNGTLIDIEKVKDLATTTRNDISPRTGTLEMLLEFKTLFDDFIATQVGYSSTLAQQAYVFSADGGFTLKEGNKVHDLSVEFDIDTKIIDSYDLETSLSDAGSGAFFAKQDFNIDSEDSTTKYTFDTLMQYVIDNYTNLMENEIYQKHFSVAAQSDGSGNFSDMLGNDELTWEMLFNDYSDIVLGSTNEFFQEFLKILVPFREKSSQLTPDGDNMSIAEIILGVALGGY